MEVMVKDWISSWKVPSSSSAIFDDGVHREVHLEDRREHHLLDAVAHLDELAAFAPLQAVSHHGLLDLLVQRDQVLVGLPRGDLQVAERALVRLLLRQPLQGLLLGRLRLRVLLLLQRGGLLRAAHSRSGGLFFLLHLVDEDVEVVVVVSGGRGLLRRGGLLGGGGGSGGGDGEAGGDAAQRRDVNVPAVGVGVGRRVRKGEGGEDLVVIVSE